MQKKIKPNKKANANNYSTSGKKSCLMYSIGGVTQKNPDPSWINQILEIYFFHLRRWQTGVRQATNNPDN